MRTLTKFKQDVAAQCNVNTNDTTAMNQIEGYVNESIRTICNLQGGKLRFLEAVKEITTVAGQASYLIPNGFRKLISVLIYSEATTAGQPYTPEMVFDPVRWNRVKQAKLGQGDVPYYVYIENQRMYIEPTPNTTGNLIQLRGRLRVKDLTIEDYTTGTITAIANNATTVTGSGTTWTANMAGRYIRIDEASGGDGFWYQIASVTSTTELELLKPYEGVTLSGGTATYTLGQTSVIPEAYDVGVVYRSAARYWQNQKDLDRAKTYWKQYDGGMEAGDKNEYGGLMLQMLANEGETEEGSYIEPAHEVGISDTPYYQPYNTASGF